MACNNTVAMIQRPAWRSADAVAQWLLSTEMVECRVPIFGITVMIWGSISHNSTWDPLGRYIKKEL